PLTLLGDESGLPYDRPPLSKHLLAGSWEPDRVALTTPDRLVELSVTHLPATAASAVDPVTRTVLTRTTDGVAAGPVRELDFDTLVVATGSRARHLPGTDGVAGVHTVRALPDALRLRDQLTADRKVVVLGGGFLGAEIAAVAAGLQAEVTVISRGDPLRRAIGEVFAAELALVHRDAGVRWVHTDNITALDLSDPDRPTVHLGDDRRIDGDVLVVAIGADPVVDWLAGTGLDLTDGVRCDAALRAAPGIFAVGDVARFPQRDSGIAARVEHRMNAGESASVVAANAMGDALVHDSIAFWWSDQFTVRLQGYGSSSPSLHLWHGHPQDRRAVALFSRSGTVCGAIGWNSAKKLREARALIAAGAPLEDAGPTVPLTDAALPLRAAVLRG
ncbi:MAG: FAD-dependent oxidoreductase, partial [Williamsia herbipolensis]|nr:FAD-dependent oxidoreductase [Williamsia herbipolensis]